MKKTVQAVANEISLAAYNRTYTTETEVKYNG
jgi:hypothetical protein